MKTINLDLDHNLCQSGPEESGTDRWYSESLARHNLRMEIVQEVGPAGGNPNVNISGREEDVRAWVREYVGPDAPESEVEFYMND